MADAKIITYGELISATTDVIPDNQAVALAVQSSDGNDVLTVDTRDGAEVTQLSAAGAAGLEVHVASGNAEVRLADEVGFISDPDLMIRRRTSNSLEFRVAGSDIFGIDVSGVYVENGNFGIGTVTPSTKFECNGAATTIGAIATALTGTFTATQGSDVINAGSSTAFTTELHVGSAIKIPSDVAAGFEIFTVDGITSDTILSLDSNYLGSTRATSGGAFTDGGELFAVKTGDSKSILSVNATGVLGLSTEPDAGTTSGGNNLGIGDPNMFDAATTMNRMTVIGNCRSNNAYSFVGGDSCVIIGFEAGHSSTTAQNSVFVGSQCADGANHIDQAVIIGQGAGRTSGDHSVHIGFTAGTAATGTNNVSVGSGALSASGAGADNVALGYAAGNAITTGEQNVSIGSGSDCEPDVDNQIAIGYGSVTDGVNKMRLGNATLATADIKVDWTVDSDERIKENIQDADAGLGFINALRPVSFTRKHPAEWPDEIREKIYTQGSLDIDEDGNEIFKSTRQFDVDTQQPIKDAFDDTSRVDGLLAQEVKAAVESLGVSFSGVNEAANGKMGIQYATLVVPLIKAVQELTARIEELENDG